MELISASRTTSPGIRCDSKCLVNFTGTLSEGIGNKQHAEMRDIDPAENIGKQEGRQTGRMFEEA